MARCPGRGISLAGVSKSKAEEIDAFCMGAALALGLGALTPAVLPAAVVGGVLGILGTPVPVALAVGVFGILGMLGAFNRKECSGGGRLGGIASPFLLHKLQ